MKPGRRTASVLSLTMLLALLATAVGVQVVRDRVYGEPSPGSAVLYIRSGEALKRIALSYSAVLADVYWIRALQYYGGTRLAPGTTKDYSLLYPLLDIATTLDPYFTVAYRFGAIFLAENYPGGAGRPDLAVGLLTKGLRYQPHRWQFLQDIGFVYYWWRHDYREAARWFEKSAQTPGAPWWMKSMAAVTLAEGGDRGSSRMLWQSMLAGAENDWLRGEAVRRLQQLDALDAIDQLMRVVQRHRERTGRNPRSWAELVATRELPGVPLDPTRVPYVLDGASGQVTVSPSSRLHPMPSAEHSKAR